MNLDLIISAISGALGAGASGALTEASKTAISDAYQGLKSLIVRKWGTKSDVVQAVNSLEAKPDSNGRKTTLQEELQVAYVDQDGEVLAAAKHLLTLIQPQQAGLGKFTIHNHAPVQGQTIGNQNTILQQFGEPPQA